MIFKVTLSASWILRVADFRALRFASSNPVPCVAFGGVRKSRGNTKNIYAPDVTVVCIVVLMVLSVPLSFIYSVEQISI